MGVSFVEMSKSSKLLLFDISISHKTEFLNIRLKMADEFFAVHHEH